MWPESRSWTVSRRFKNPAGRNWWVSHSRARSACRPRPRVDRGIVPLTGSSARLKTNRDKSALVRKENRQPYLKGPGELKRALVPPPSTTPPALLYLLSISTDSTGKASIKSIETSKPGVTQSERCVSTLRHLADASG